MISRTACFRSVVLICFLAINLVGQQREHPSAVSLRVDPAYLELRVGRAHKFSAEAQGLPAAATVVWLLKEKRGASITDDGVFTATKPGVYHVVAIATVDGTVLKHATAKITVLQQYGCCRQPSLKRPSPTHNSAFPAAASSGLHPSRHGLWEETCVLRRLKSGP